MRRFVLLTSIGLTLACFAGCHQLHQKPLAAACSPGCAPCACEGSTAVALAPIAGRTSVVVPGPSDGIPGPPGGGTPGPPGR